jgi:hypothetical protein
MAEEKELSEKEKATIARRAYMREYARKRRRKNPDYQVKYWASKYDKLQKQGKGR